MMDDMNPDAGMEAPEMPAEETSEEVTAAPEEGEAAM